MERIDAIDDRGRNRGDAAGHSPGFRMLGRPRAPRTGSVMAMGATNADRIRALLKGIETGDPASVAVISPTTYIQHNPQTHEGREGLAALFGRLSKSNPRVNIVRAFEDGDHVFAHTEYDFSTRRIGFEVFRFEDGLAVEHWDNIQPRLGPNASGHSMVDGPTEAVDLDRTEANRKLVRAFIEQVLIQRRLEEAERHIDDTRFTQHSPHIEDGLGPFRAALEAMSGDGWMIAYDRVHRVLAQGNFVLAVSEGSLDGVHSSFYDLFRVADGKIVEHWETIEGVPPQSEWKNDNGKF
jgi:predicted SnoaL-like aldol condensation-catalyzing enzyme